MQTQNTQLKERVTALELEVKHLEEAATADISRWYYYFANMFIKSTISGVVAPVLGRTQEYQV